MRRIFLKLYTLRKLLLLINLVVLAIPIVGVGTLRIFENFLHRQTEEELIAQATYIQPLFLKTLKEISPGIENDPAVYKEAEVKTRPTGGKWKPYLPTVDISRQKVLPSAPDGAPYKGEINPTVLAAGGRIEPILRDAQLQNLTAIRVLDKNGVVIATTLSEMGLDLSHRKEISEALKGKYSAVLRKRMSDSNAPPMGSISRASRIRVFVAMPIMEGDRIYGVVYLSRTSLSLFRALWDARYGMALIIMLLITIGLSLALSYILIRPLKTMVRQAERIADGESGVSVDTGPLSPAEAQRLSHALSLMIEKMEARLNFVKEFSSNVSHEFKTPLTSIQGAIELLKDNWKDMPEEDRGKFLNIIDAESHRMERLVVRLMQLARIETSSHSDDATDLKGMLETIVRKYREDGRDISLQTDPGAEKASIAADMAETMFINLIENAVIHGKGSPVSVKIEKGPVVSVTDRGPGISDANMAKIFNRFFTTTRAEGGTGLGLAMVKSIVGANGGDIEVNSDADETVFKVRLKPAGN